jgi:hypothetical protein
MERKEATEESSGIEVKERAERTCANAFFIEAFLDAKELNERFFIWVGKYNLRDKSFSDKHIAVRRTARLRK